MSRQDRREFIRDLGMLGLFGLAVIGLIFTTYAMTLATIIVFEPFSN